MPAAIRCRLRAAAAESRVLVVAAEGWRRVRAAWSFSTTRRSVASRLAPLEGYHAAATIDESWLLRAIERWFELVVIGWRGSSSRQWMERTFLGSRSAEARVATVGWIAFCASATHVALVGFGTLLGAPGTGVGWLAVLLLAGVCIHKPRSVAAALAWSGLFKSRRRPDLTKNSVVGDSAGIGTPH